MDNLEDARFALELLDSDLADRVQSMKDNAKLRLFACECASLALMYCGNGDPRSLSAVDVARLYATGMANDDELNAVYAKAEQAANAADAIAFNLRDALEEGKVSESKYLEAFAAARAAFSAQDCCRRPEIVAANDAAYEAWAALSTIVENGSNLNGLVPHGMPNTAIDTFLVNLLKTVLGSVGK